MKEIVLTPKELNEHLTRDYKTWKSIYENGCSDPSFTDGVNLNLVRNHIIYGKMQCEKILGDSYHLYPDSYFFPIPAQLPSDFMAVCRKLPVLGLLLNPTKHLPYSEVMKFSWSEISELL